MILVLAKLVGLGVTAFIFEVTKDKLLQMAWFRRVYAFFLWARDWAHEKVDADHAGGCANGRMRPSGRSLGACGDGGASCSPAKPGASWST